MTHSAPVDAQVAHALIQVMVRHGVASVSNDLGRAGSLSMHPGGQAVHFGLHLTWLPWQEHEKLWQAVGLPGTPQPIRKDEDAFYQELMAALYTLNIGRVTWTNDTKSMFSRDSTAPTGLAFRVSDLECFPREQASLGLDIHFQA